MNVLQWFTQIKSNLVTTNAVVPPSMLSSMDIFRNFVPPGSPVKTGVPNYNRRSAGGIIKIPGSGGPQI